MCVQTSMIVETMMQSQWSDIRKEEKEKHEKKEWIDWRDIRVSTSFSYLMRSFGFLVDEVLQCE